MVWTVFGVILGLFSVGTLILGVMGLFNGEDYSYRGSVRYNDMGPFTMSLIYGLIAYALLTMK